MDRAVDRAETLFVVTHVRRGIVDDVRCFSEEGAALAHAEFLQRRANLLEDDIQMLACDVNGESAPRWAAN